MSDMSDAERRVRDYTDAVVATEPLRWKSAVYRMPLEDARALLDEIERSNERNANLRAGHECYVDTETDTSWHPFVASREDASLCGHCGEHTSWHPGFRAEQAEARVKELEAALTACHAYVNACATHWATGLSSLDAEGAEGVVVVQGERLDVLSDKAGHPLTAGNVRIQRGTRSRTCIACAKERSRLWYRKTKAAKTAFDR